MMMRIGMCMGIWMGMGGCVMGGMVAMGVITTVQPAVPRRTLPRQQSGHECDRPKSTEDFRDTVLACHHSGRGVYPRQTGAQPGFCLRIREIRFGQHDTVSRRDLTHGLSAVIDLQAGIDRIHRGQHTAIDKRALEMIETQGLIRRFSGHGFVVAGTDADPKREDLRGIELDLSTLASSVGKPSWLRVYDDVARHVTRCPAFGRYRIYEAQMAEEYGVSRTIVRDVLGRLQERGLIQKSRTSRRMVEPLTSKKIKAKYELRSILEVAALNSAHLPTEKLRALADDIRALSDRNTLTPDQWFSLDRRFFELLILTTPNEDLANYAASNRLALEACQSALLSLGLPPDSSPCSNSDRLSNWRCRGRSPLRQSCCRCICKSPRPHNRTIAQLKITAFIAPPPDFPAYLQFT
nr:hypothetical protein [uncultured Celeribacter sp.]